MWPALHSGLKCLGLDLRGRVYPSSRLQCLPAAFDPEPPVELGDSGRNMVPRVDDSPERGRVQQCLVLAVPAAASMRAIRWSVLREMSSSRFCRATLSARRCRSSSSGEASSTRQSLGGEEAFNSLRIADDRQAIAVTDQLNLVIHRRLLRCGHGTLRKMRSDLPIQYDPQQRRVHPPRLGCRRG